jgi:hypothetical protein
MADPRILTDVEIDKLNQELMTCIRERDLLGDRITEIVTALNASAEAKLNAINDLGGELNRIHRIGGAPNIDDRR